MKNIKVEWCENFIKAVFEKIPFENGGIYTELFWDEAEKSGLWIRGTCGTPMSSALENLTVIEDRLDDDRNYLYSVFKLKKIA